MSMISNNAGVLREYFTWLEKEMRKRFSQYFHAPSENPLPVFNEPLSLPEISFTDTALHRFMNDNNLDVDEQFTLVLALAPHANPYLLERIIYDAVDKPNLPNIGGFKGEQFQRFLPNGETVFLLLAGNDLTKRIEVKGIFGEERVLAKQQVVWLEDPPEGEPLTGSKLVISHEYVDLFLTGSYTRPKFGSNFPAERITTALEWEDLVVNEQTMKDIRELRKWIYQKEELLKINKRIKPGYRALFHGPPGTGKTLTASLLGKKGSAADGDEINAQQKDFDVYRIDLSLVVSKFIGETEKNLAGLFDKAENKDWILFFDEADALFGKRTGIRDAHDKYANQEVSYLLQRIENYNGLVILATNFKSNLDTAFTRRFQAEIQFLLPNATERLKIWQSIITESMLEDKNTLRDIADIYEMTGASIINIAQHCFLKHMNEKGIIPPLKKTELEDAIIREFKKEGKIIK